jgi:hypothetical protein
LSHALSPQAVFNLYLRALDSNKKGKKKKSS